MRVEQVQSLLDREPFLRIHLKQAVKHLPDDRCCRVHAWVLCADLKREKLLTIVIIMLPGTMGEQGAVESALNSPVRLVFLPQVV
jgi:hypothetical protein